MAIFQYLEFEPVVQVKDKTRLNALKSFATTGSLTAIEIKPSASDNFFDVTTDGYLDWAYSASGTVTVTVSVKQDSQIASGSYTLSVVSEDEDYLFSNDQQLILHEPDILRWVREGRNSFIDVHRRAQQLIIKWLDEQGYVDIYDNPYTKQAIVNISEVSDWSVALVLQLIFEGISNSVDDVFAQKAKVYEAQAQRHRNRAVIRLDADGDGTVDDGEELDVLFGLVVRR